ncbi:PREDICTED: methylosome subunit pICln [Nicrophorus vespilloides]|uniref:Methylosome subunit pICln n=1 Tax=Nicrophorus vespilloides TaxID=110193 RepID=A0ABM1MTQ4_NICVS|nr:PREDICTED: methylosome subunit pICln [Nicrophorus vespilloides]
MVVLSSFIHPDSPVHLEQRNIRAVLDKKNIGEGTLFISERTLCWKDDDIGFCLTYPHISLHAISNDPAVHQSQCIYVMIDAHVKIPGINYEDVPEINSESDDESDADISELLLIPHDPATVHNIYEALKQCQELNPDPEDVDDDDDDIYEDADENMDSNEDAFGGGGDNDMENIVNQIRSNTMDINYDYSNGDHISEDIFEDAD